jgi:UDP-N-acetylmuramate--alanine ligase
MKKRKIHFTGIKGVGMTPLAIIAKESGMKVSGSDLEQKFITDIELEEKGIFPYLGFSSDNIKDVDFLIFTGAHGGANNIEVVSAKEKGIEVLNQGQALGVFQSGKFFGKDFFGISIAGSHGKTTTTAIIATMLKENQLDPSYVIGTGRIPSLGLSGHFGKSKYFVTEADEYPSDLEFDRTPKFLYQKPKIILVTNIDFDHPDFYSSMNDTENIFLKFLDNLPNDGILIACGDGEDNRNFLSKYDGKKITYGFSPENDYVLERVNFDQEKMFFWVKAGETELGQFSTQVFGEQNALNCLGAIISGLEVGLSIAQVKKGISVFKGTKRRSEYIGVLKNGQLLYDDYAHHPKEISETLKAFKTSFPKYKIIPIFQPHMYSRTKILFNDFINSFENADEVYVTEIFTSFREPVDKTFSTNLLVQKFNQNGKKAVYFSKTDDVVKYIPSQNYPKDTLFITMGAGDIYKIGSDILKNG